MSQTSNSTSFWKRSSTSRTLSILPATTLEVIGGSRNLQELATLNQELHLVSAQNRTRQITLQQILVLGIFVSTFAALYFTQLKF